VNAIREQTLSGNAWNRSRVMVLRLMIPDKSEKLRAHCRERSNHKSENGKDVLPLLKNKGVEL
jgi:hypothetical protein